MVASGHNSDLCAVLKLDRIAGARNGLVRKLDAHELHLGAVGLLVSDGLLADELVLVQFAEHAETGGDRRDLRGKLVTVQRQSGLETQGVTATESARHHTGLQESVPILHDEARSRVDLESVLASVTGTADDDPHSGILEILECVECQAGGVGGVTENLHECLFGLRALERDLSPVVGIVDQFHIVTLGVILYPEEILLDVGGVHHEKIVVSGELLVNQKIIHGATVRVKHHSVQHLTRNHRTDVIGEYVVDELFRVRAADEDLTHVRHIEHTHIVADRQMLLCDRRVLNRHIESSERTHLGSKSHVAVMKTGNFELLLHNQLSVFSI